MGKVRNGPELLARMGQPISWTSCGGSISDDAFKWDFGPVPADEIAFALSLFFAAAQRRILPKRLPTSNAELLIGQAGRRAFEALAPTPTAPFPKTEEYRGSTLSEAFLAVWQHYAGDERQASVCARVLGFQLLMERTEGAAVEPWLTPSPDDPETVVLHTAVIEAIGAVPLLEEGRLPEKLFIQTIAAYAEGKSPAPNVIEQQLEPNVRLN